MEDGDRLALANFFKEHREVLQCLQSYLDMKIDQITKDTIEYITRNDMDTLLIAKGKIEAYQELKELDADLES